MVLMTDTSSKVSRDSVWRFGGVKSILGGYDGLIGGAGSDWRGGEGFLNEVGQLGLGARQFGLSERFGLRAEGSLWGGGSLQPSEWPGLGRLDLWEVPLSSRSTGGTYQGDSSRSAHVVVRKRACRIAVT